MGKLSRWLNRRARKRAFVLSVNTAALYYAIAGKTCDNPLWPLDEALRVDPMCIPTGLEFAAWEFIDSLLWGKPRPEWVRYLPEGTF